MKTVVDADGRDVYVCDLCEKPFEQFEQPLFMVGNIVIHLTCKEAYYRREYLNEKLGKGSIA